MTRRIEYVLIYASYVLALRWPRATDGRKMWLNRERIRRRLLRRCSSNSFRNSRYRGGQKREAVRAELDILLHERAVRASCVMNAAV